MINKLLHWAAKKRGFILEDRNQLVLINKAEDTTFIQLATVMADGKAIRLSNLEGTCIGGGDTLKVYITR